MTTEPDLSAGPPHAGDVPYAAAEEDEVTGTYRAEDDGRTAGPRLRGPKAWALLRTLAEVTRPFGVRELAEAVEVDPGYVSRFLRVLEDELLVTRTPRGPVTDIEWEGVIRKAARAHAILGSSGERNRMAESSPFDRELLDNVPDAIVVANDAGVVVQANAQADELFDAGPGGLIGRSVDELVPDEFRGGHAAHRARFGTSPHRRPMGAGVELSAKRCSGGTVPVEISLSPATHEGNRFVIAAIRDVSERRRFLRALQTSELRFRRLFDDAPIGMALVDANGSLLAANGRFLDLAGLVEEAAVGTAIEQLVHVDDQTAVLDAVAELAAGVLPSIRFECRLAPRVEDDDERWGRVAVSTAGGDDDGQLIVQIEDVSAERAAEARMEHLALHDELTGLPNRSLAVDRIAQALARASRTGEWVALAFLDLDHFKVVNDSIGHTAGDELLRQVAKRLANALRPADTVARFGGDEFVVCLSDLGADSAFAQKQAVATLERMREAVQGSYDLHGVAAFADFTCGVALGTGTASAEALVRDADAAMYRGKQRGRGSIEIFDAAHRAHAVARLTLESELRAALDEGQLRVFYQPIVDVTTRAVVSVEALLRWQAADGLRPPLTFLDVADETGLIIPIGEWVAEQVCHDLPRLDERYGPGLQTVAFNVSVRQLQRSHFAAQLEKIAAAAAVPTERLVIEVTEQQVLEFVDSVTRQIDALAGLGVGIALDDFGTGYGSLSYLRRLPVTSVKIDRSFVAGLVDNREDHAIAEAVITLADALGMTTVAEGVETDTQAAAITALGVTYAQGYLYGRPAPLDEP